MWKSWRRHFCALYGEEGCASDETVEFDPVALCFYDLHGRAMWGYEHRGQAMALSDGP
jgi:hypothetical protein